MKNKDLALSRFNAKQKRGNSVQSRMTQWLLDNSEAYWTVADMVERFDTTHRCVSSAIKNTEVQLGFVYRKIKRHAFCNNYRTYTLVDCRSDGEEVETPSQLLNSIFN